jgi:hypothetical protein
MGGDDGLVQVHLVGLPLQARTRFSQHLRDLTRELSLIQIGAVRSTTTSLPPRLLQIATELDTTYAAFRAAPDAVVEAALAAGEDFCDVTYTVPPSAGAFLQRLGAILEEADDFCRAEQHLLSLPASEEVVAYRRWMVAESARQLAGEPPRPWRHLPPTAAVGAPNATTEPASAEPLPRSAAPEPTAGSGESGVVVGEPLTMESVASSTAAARRYVRERLGELGLAQLEEAAELGVSELVTNALLHARTAFTLTVRTTVGGGVRIEVTDSAPTLIQPRRLVTTATTGRGLQLVAAVSSRWGIADLPAELGPGKTVWFEPAEFTIDLATPGAEWVLDLDALL